MNYVDLCKRSIATNALCTKEVISTIIIHNLPIVDLGNDTATCNTLVTLDAGAGFNNYLWSTGATTQTIIAFNTSVYSVIVTDSIGCSNSDSVDVTINPLPFITLNAFGNIDTLCLSSGLFVMNSGNPAGGTFSGTGVTGNTFDPSLAGLGLHYIIYSYTDSNNCSNYASNIIIVYLCLGLNLFSADDDIKIYPNPASSSITIISSRKNNFNLELSIYDMIGSEVKHVELTGKKTIADISALSPGNYVIKISENDTLKRVQQLIKY